MISELFLTTVISTAAAAAGTVAFALLFGVPRRFLLFRYDIFGNNLI